ncbi:GNAT family N-acetyltransferase [Mycoplasmatota bacterium WC44]
MNDCKTLINQSKEKFKRTEHESKLVISRPSQNDVETLHNFFENVIRDTFIRNGISNLKEEIRQEIEDKRNFLVDDLENNGCFFLVATVESKLIGSISCKQANELIVKCTNGTLKEVLELGTVYVHPEYQKQGIGSTLVYEMCQVLHKIGVKTVCLDSGYKIAQKVWLHLLGKPEYHLRNYWGDNADHMIWKVEIDDVLKRLKSNRI